MNYDADAIIVGAGHNGLAAGALLARKGWDVLVLEQSSRPGGACKTDELTRPGFKHDLYATNIGLFLGSPTYEELGDEMHQAGFDIALSEHPYSSVFPDGDGVGVWKDAERTRQAFESFSEADADSFEELVQYFHEVSPYLFPLLQTPLPSVKAGRKIMNMVRKEGLKDTLELFSMILKSPREFVNHWFEHEKIQSLFIPWAFHLDYGPDVSGGALFPFLEGVVDHLEGMAFAKGGSSNLINGLVSVLEQNGGSLRTDEPVSRVLVEDGNAVGVETAGGEVYRAGKAVIGNLTPTVLFDRLVEDKHLSNEFRRKVDNYRYGPGTMMMHFALSEPLEWKAGEHFQDSAYVHIGPYVDDVARTYQQVMAGKLPDSPMLVVGQPTTVDPSRAPEGKHVLWVQVRAVPRDIEGDGAEEITDTGWEDVKEPFSRRVIDKLERYAPGVRDRILEYTTLAPTYLENDNPNLVGGDSLGGSHHLDQHYAFRPFPGWSRYETPVDQLYMVGASTWPGAGLNATSGYLLAEELTSTRMSKIFDFIGG